MSNSVIAKIAQQQTKTTKKTANNTMARAWNIARQAARYFNTLPDSIMKSGLSKASEFFQEALRLAWEEVKGGSDKFKNPVKEERKISKMLEDIAFYAEDLVKTGILLMSEEFKLKVSNYAQLLISDKRGKTKAQTSLDASQLDLFAF
ncbi:hypothetical protein C9J27_04320 [Photobacterium kishitanii]|uniref:Uncharacterized protein n=2 Tax=Photobacterium kishitanii TaxID=318456 RepID=A0A2T3KKW0_9GAMM|nr:hypothetical protein C9J27_04320 [Photobacterium kishitanii]